MEIAFTGEVQPTSCPCHPNKFVVLVFQVHPELGLRLCGNDIFDTEKEATQKMEATVMRVAEEILAMAGLKADDAKKVTIERDDAADAQVDRIMRENNPLYH